MDHSHSEDQLWGAVEILPQRLYYAPLKFFPPRDDDDDNESDNDGETTSTNNNNQSNQSKAKKKKSIHYFSIDNELIYWNFFLDFGPLNLGQLHRFSSILNDKLSNPEYKNDIICYYSSAKGTARANATFLICAWSMLYLGRTLEESYFGFMDDGEEDNSGSNNTSLPPQKKLSSSQFQRTNSNASSSSSSSGEGIHNNSSQQQQSQPSPFANIHPLPPFHDASPIVCTYDLSVYDCLQGLDKARRLNFFKFDNTPPSPPPLSVAPHYTKPPRPSSSTSNTFNVNEYEYFEQVENGDLNWLVQDKILAFAGPQSQKLVTPEGFCLLTPADYIPYFIKSHVKLVVRLNKKCYEESDFENVGIRHVEHYYLDGSCPPLDILHAVVSDMESINDNEAMAVHCKAGLGRTGTCIGAYLMKHYRLTARDVIGWMRICRPGMVIGPQQHFLEDIQGLMWQEGEMYRSSGLQDGTMMSIDGGGGEDEEEEDMKMSATTAVAVSPARTHNSSPVAATPRTRSGTSTSANVALVTPDGQQIHLPTTPVVAARKLDVDTSSAAMDISSLPSPTTTGLNEGEEEGTMKEGDQANALLSRRFQARQHSK